MEWAIVAVVLLAIGGVAWYVLRSTPSAADIEAAGTDPNAGRDSSGKVTSDTPGAIPRGQNVVPDVDRLRAAGDALARYAVGLH